MVMARLNVFFNRPFGKLKVTNPAEVSARLNDKDSLPLGTSGDTFFDGFRSQPVGDCCR